MNLKDFLASRDKPPELYWSLVIGARLGSGRNMVYR